MTDFLLKETYWGDSYCWLVEWKSNLYRKPLFIWGARQVGKTWSVLEIANTHCNGNKHHINFEKNPDLIATQRQDFAKYGTRRQQEYLQTVLKYCGQNPCGKINYSNIDRDTRSTFLKESVSKLELSRIVHKVVHTNANKVPLTIHSRDDVYKTVFLDIGFVNQVNHIGLTALENLIIANEGMLAEQCIGQELLAGI